MADFRKSLLLAAVAIVVGVGTASAQNAGTCSGNSGNDPLLRSEGQTELTGSISLVCNTVSTGFVNFDITLNNGTVPLTSRTNEAMAIVSYPGTDLPSTTTYGVITSLGGSAVGSNDMQFDAVPITSPNPTITISGIRANVNPAYVPLNSGGFGQVLAVISVSNGVLPITLVNGGLFVGIVYPGLGPVTVTGPSLSTCAGVINLGAGVNFTINVPELFPTVFKVQGPIGNQDSETGPTSPATQANSATQLAVSMASLPAGITFYLPETIYSTASGVAVLVTGPGVTTPLTSGVALDTSGNLYVGVGTGTTYYYNVISTNSSVTEAFAIPVYNSAASFTSGFAPTVTVNLGPAASIAPTTVPRFLGAAPAVGLGFSTSGCQTSLLFPFMTNQAGFDTGFSIDASGTDPFGDTVAGGTCTMYFYGAGAPTTPPVLTVPAAGEGHATISAVAPNFQGYGIAVCNFTYAHGYAFISDGFMGGGRGLSEGYVALVINDRTGASTSPEVLSH
jgi:hypothetical protein